MSDTGIVDRQRVRDVYGDSNWSLDGRLAVALGIIAMLIGLGAIVTGAWIAYGNTATMFHLPGGMPPAEGQTISLYLVACGALTTLLGGFSIYKSQDM
ncbi:hypothetical protein [Roseomonas sp. CECT 9278]|uniref:hypothetical protein n=1 Tax=Roseomonas sp. CECT 9278 TaxID=2845823 RepID=UPI001E4AA64D|nr:hypothetical protein [Roseomonas sp. CECT 9278]CAH0213536.1 hypothetical protein ROS9278_02224 [Roseomonas sp. CECT 9278]